MKLNKLISSTAVSICLYRVVGSNLVSTEVVSFSNPAGVDTVLRRAAISGHVDAGGKIANHFADLLDSAGDIVETVALDRKSYGALKNRWMRCKVVRS